MTSSAASGAMYNCLAMIHRLLGNFSFVMFCMTLKVCVFTAACYPDGGAFRASGSYVF